MEEMVKTQETLVMKIDGGGERRDGERRSGRGLVVENGCTFFPNR